MHSATAANRSFSLKAYAGDFKTLLAFDLAAKDTARLAGFTIAVRPGDGAPYYLFNELQFQFPAKHAQDAKEPPYSSANAPLRKFRWLHVPGSYHQGVTPFTGPYAYTVTPRYFDANGSLEPIDASLGATATITVQPFEKGALQLGFTRGFTQSQAFVNHFGLKALIRPKGKELQFDTSQPSGTNSAGQSYTYAQEYAWLGFTARARIFDLLHEVQQNARLHLDVFAYDLNEPDVVGVLLELAKQGRIRIVLDDAALHSDKTGTKAEDEFEAAFRQVAGGEDAPILRGHFKRYAHDKVFIVSDGASKKAVKVLTGSTNFSVTGLYVNSNHVLVFDDPIVAQQYADLFDEVWKDRASQATFVRTDLSKRRYKYSSAAVPPTQFTFAPHDVGVVEGVLGQVVDRIKTEEAPANGRGSVFFAVMAIDQTGNPVYDVLRGLHATQTVFSYGISDSPGGIVLYKPGVKNGLLVTGKPLNTVLPPPFSQVPNIGGIGHQVHHKFVVCGFNGADPTVFCGSSNLAAGGENANGDNLLAIHDADVATAFAIEAIGLVDHFNFLDKYATGSKPGTAPAPASPRQAALDASSFLRTDDAWVKPYYDRDDLHCADRELFAGSTAKRA